MNKNNYFSKLLAVLVIFLFFVIFKTNSAIIKDETLVLTNITIIDGNGGKPLKHMSIIISNGHIEDIFQSGSKDIPEKSTVIDLPGHYVIPGLIDSHYHFMIGMRSKEIEELFRQFALLGGITTVRDMAGDAVELAILKKASEDGTVLSPRIYFSALMRGTIDERMKGISHGLPIGEAPWALVVTGQTDLVKAVADAKSTGATGIKLYSDLSLELIIKITNEAHKQGLKVWSHSAIYPVKPSDAVNAGVDVISHSNLIVSEGMENVPSRYDSSYEFLDYDSVSIGSSAISNLLELMLINGTVLDPSMLVTSKLENTEKGKIFQDPKKMAEWSYMVTMRAHIRKIPIVAGTDIQESPRTQDYPNIHKEMELLVEKAGFTPLEAITSATRNGAQVLGVLDSYGTISIGKVADLVILGDDPSMDIKNTTKIYAVIKGGVIHEWRKTILPD